MNYKTASSFFEIRFVESRFCGESAKIVPIAITGPAAHIHQTRGFKSILNIDSPSSENCDGIM